MPKQDLLHVASVPLPQGKRLSQRQYREVEQFLDDWRKEVLAAVKAHPKKSYALGRAQTEAFLRLLGRLNTMVPPGGVGPGPTTTAAVKWLNTYTLHELDTSLQEYVNKIKDSLLYGLQATVNPLQVASWLQKATKDAEVNWRMVARTEMVRANAAGRLAVCREQGYDKVWAPPHVGSCKKCRQLIENKVFRIKDVEGVTNFGRDQRDWVACIPVHPHCRHAWVPYIPEVYDEMQRQYNAFQEAGLNDQVLDEMFDSGGHLKPEYENDPRLAPFKSADPFAHVLAHTITKVRAENVSKGFFDNPQLGLDPLLWEGRRLRSEVRDHLVHFWRSTLGEDAPLWSHIYLAGGATSPQWESVARPEADPDVDMQIVVDYPALRERHEEWRVLSDPELHGVLVTRVKAALAGQEAAPGLRLDAFIRPETTYADFEADARQIGQGVYDIPRSRWLVEPVVTAPAEAFGTPIMEGVGATTAMEHPTWVQDGSRLVQLLESLLDEYEESGDPLILNELQAFYTRLHDMRHEGFEGRDGNRSRGNFLWQYLVNFGPLMRLKHLLHPEALKTFAPDYTWTFTPENEDDWHVTKQGHWPLPVGTEIVTKAGTVDVVKARTGPGTYATFTGESITHDDVFSHVPVEKVAPNPTEHWITVHPHGEGEEGIPVLVREMSDGSMMVIGGAGGHLNHLRLDPKRRIEPKKDKGGESDELQAPKVEEQPVSAEEAQRQAEEHEKAYTLAKEKSAEVQAKKKEMQQQLFDYVKSTLQLKPTTDPETGEVKETTWDDLDPKVQAKLVNTAIKDAMKTVVHTTLAAKDTQESGIKLPQPKHDEKFMESEDPSVAEDGDEGRELMDAADEAERESESQVKEPKISLAKWTLDDANSVAEMKAEMALLNKQLVAHNRVIRGEGKIEDALALDYSPKDVTDAVKSKVSAEMRTFVARQLAEAVDEEKARTPLGRAMKQGAYDTVDTFAQAILGESQINRDVADLLGVGGMAQLVAWKLRKEAKAGSVDLDAAFRTLNDLSSERETVVSNRALARSRESAAMAKALYEEVGKSEQGESEWTMASARSMAARKVGEAATALGFAIAGHEAASALKVALGHDFGAKELRIGGFKSEAALRDAAARCGLDAADGFGVKKHGPGDYELRVNPERLEHLFEKPHDPKQELKDKLASIRTADDLDAQVQQDMRNSPGMVQKLKPAQARGKRFLLTAKHGVCAFAPGVGKTHTAVAAALEYLSQPGNEGKRVLVVAPPAAHKGWDATVKAQDPKFTSQVIGTQFDHTVEGDDDQAGTKELSQKAKRAQIDAPCHFNIVSYEYMRQNPDLMAKLGADIVIADEAQKAKSDNSQNFQRLTQVGANADHRWALTGTLVEKNVGELHSVVRWAKGDEQAHEDLGTKSSFMEKYNKLAQYQHLTAEDRIRQFREGISDSVYALDAADGGSNLPSKNEGNPEGDASTVKVDMTPEHKAYYREQVQRANTMMDEAREKYKAGDITRNQLNSAALGTGRMLTNALHNPPEDRVPTLAQHEAIDKLIRETPDVDFKGVRGADGTLSHSEHEGKLMGKSMVFSTELKPLKRLQAHLAAQGHEVYLVDGTMNKSQRDKVLSKFMERREADPSGKKVVLLSTDALKTAVSLQLGDNNGNFQHGATNMVHLTLPANNGDIQQREARIHRSGAAAPVTTNRIDMGTGTETNLFDKLSQERRTQDLVGNPEDADVRTHEGGRTETIASRYGRAKGDKKVGGSKDRRYVAENEKGEKEQREYPKVEDDKEG